MDAQISELREWISSANGRTYRDTDKRRYAALKSEDGAIIVMEPIEAIDWLEETGETYRLEQRWMTAEQFEQMPEFQGA